MPVPPGNQIIAMKIEESTYELIARFLNGQSSESEMQMVQERLSTDTVFAEEVEWYRQFSEDMKDQRAFNVLSQIEEIHQQKKAALQRKFRWTATAAVLALVLIAYLVISGKGVDSAAEPGQVIEDSVSGFYADMLPDWQDYVVYAEGLQSLGESSEELLAKALELMQAGNHKAARPFLTQYLEALPAGEEDFERRLELGKIWLLEERNTNKAKEQFQYILDQEALPEFQEAASFHLAITHVLSGDTASAKVLLDRLIANQRSPYANQAARILEQLPEQ